MTDIKFFLQFFGYIMILIGLAMLISKSSREELINLSKDNIMFFGFVNIIFGLPIIIVHNKWVGVWEAIISLIAWLSVIKGFIRILNLPYFNKLREEKLNNLSESMLKKYSFVIIIIGGVFIYGSFLKV